MKTTFKFIIAAMAAVSVFSSCQKELANETVNNTTGGARTIAVQFDNSTKATLDGFTPKFANGDAIRVSNTEKSEECTVSVDGSGNATFTTTLSGALTAIYPSAAAVLTPGTPDGKITGFKVSTSQTGELKDAIIAKATIAENSSEATFQGQTAVFRITPGAGTSTRYVEVITAGPEIANTTTTGYTKKNKIHVETDDSDEVFVSVLVPAGGLKLRDLSFADGSNMKTVINTTAIAANTIYTIKGDSGWDKPYVEINGLKWAKMNIGASSETEFGEYFAWGETTGHVCSGTTTGSTFSHNFNWSTAPFNNGQSTYYASYFTSVKDSECPGGILALKNDAANANWGGSWRMPTKAEFEALGTGTWVTSPVKGCEFGTSSKIFLPAAGYGDSALRYGGFRGYYWSSSLYTDNLSRACFLIFSSSDAGSAGNGDRSYGQSVRALSD